MISTKQKVTQNHSSGKAALDFIQYQGQPLKQLLKTDLMEGLALPKKSSVAPIITPPVANSKVAALHFASLSELDAYTIQPLDILAIPKVKLTDVSQRNVKSNKTLVCHDFKGGYVKDHDESPFGYFPHSCGIHYSLRFPQYVDSFVYFTHHRVSVPPVGWVNSLHRMGIPVYGTVCIEGDEYGEADQLLVKTAHNSYKYVDKLVALAEKFNFDGYFFNMETHFTRTPLAREMVRFVETLKTKLHTINCKLIWYDSFISSHNCVAYQNGVNFTNYDFFEASDFFFTNYWWDQNHLASNQTNVGVLGCSKKLYVGVDVWGRGMKLCSGGFTSYLAMKSIQESHTNTGIFAPGWTFEHFGKNRFYDADDRFWESIAEVKTASRDSVILYPDGFCFYTNFCTGNGSAFYVDSQQVYSQPWVNIDLQMNVPACKIISHKSDNVSVDYTNAFCGGSSLRMKHRNLITEDLLETLTLFNFREDVTSKKLRIRVVFKYDRDDAADNEIYQLEIGYYIERRYKTVERVKEGVFKVPLRYSDKRWQVYEYDFILPPVRRLEHIVLKSLTMRWVDTDTEAIDTAVSTSELDWIMIPNADCDQVYDLLLGEICLQALDGKIKDFQPIEKAICIESVGDDIHRILRWRDEKEVHYWFVYENGCFVGSCVTNNWVIKGSVELRVDALKYDGTIIRGVPFYL